MPSTPSWDPGPPSPSPTACPPSSTRTSSTSSTPGACSNPEPTAPCSARAACTRRCIRSSSKAARSNGGAPMATFSPTAPSGTGKHNPRRPARPHRQLVGGSMNAALRLAGGSGVELAGEVLQAAVDLDGDHAVPGAEPAGDADSGGQVGTGRGPGEDALGAGGLAGGFERLGFGNGHDLVIVGGVELGRAVADAASLDVMGSRWPA